MQAVAVAPYVGAWIETSIVLHSESFFWSHPMWVRGLKQHILHNCLRLRQVAPYVGAWIETALASILVRDASVAPYVGAWIETVALASHFAFAGVAPYVGAWIETSLDIAHRAHVLSHPMWVRGLKLSYALLFD